MAVRIVGVALFIATLAFVMVGSVATVRAQGSIHACVKTSQGQLRIVAPAESCLAGEQRLEWPASLPSSLGTLRVVDVDGKFIGRYGNSGLTCPDPNDSSVLHGSVGHLGVYSRELVQFALGLPESPNVLYYPGADDPAFVVLSVEWDSSSYMGWNRVCQPFTDPSSFQKYAPALTFDLGVFTPPFRVTE